MDVKGLGHSKFKYLVGTISNYKNDNIKGVKIYQNSLEFKLWGWIILHCS